MSRSCRSFRALGIVSAALVVGALALPGAALAAGATNLSLHQGATLFSALDGGPQDADGTSDGTLTVSSLTIAGNAELIVDVPAATVEADGDVSLAGNGSIHASDPAPAQGPTLEIHAGGAVRLVGTSSIRADGSGAGGQIRICSGADLVVDGNADVSASSTALSGPGGSIHLEAAGQVILAQPAGSVQATGADGGSVEIVSCATDRATPAHAVNASAIAIQGRVEASGTDGSGGSIDIEARQGGVAFLPAVTSVDARGTAGGGSVQITAATSVTPSTPPTAPAATVTTGTPSDVPCDCQGGGAVIPGLFIHAAVDRPSGSTGTTFQLSGEVVRSESPVSGWTWTLSDGRTFDGRTVTVQFDEPGLYGAEVTASNEDGLQATSETGVVIFDPNTQAPAELGLPDKIGDVDGDGAITLADAHRVAKQASGLEPLPLDLRSTADVDLDGHVTARDARLLGQAVAAGEPLPRAISPEHGAPGARINLISPELLDPDALIQVEVGASHLVQTLVRAARGYATFMVPLDPTTAGSFAVNPGPVDVRILKDGQVVETHTFEVEAPPPLPADPKAELKGLLNDYTTLLERNQAAVANALDLVGVSSDTRQLLLAAFDLAHQDLSAKVDRLEAILDQPGGDELARFFFRFADANGYGDLRDRMDAFLAGPSGQALSSLAERSVDPDAALAAICAVREASDLIDTGGKILSYTCDALLVVAIGAAVVPGAGEVVDAGLLLAWAAECGSVEATAELALLVNSLIGDLDAELDFEASPSAPQNGEVSILKSDLVLVGLDDVCALGANVGTDKLGELLAKKAVERLLRTKLALRSVAKLVKLLSDSLLETLTKRLESAVGSVVDATGLADALQDLASSACESFGVGAPVPIDIQPILSGPAPNVGTLSFPGDGTAEYHCPTDPNQSADSVSFTVEKELCDEPVTKDATVECETRPVTITMGDNGNLNDDIFEVQIDGETVLTSSTPVRSISTTVELAPGDYTVNMIGRAAPDGVGTYYISFSGATVIAGDALSGYDLTPGTVKTYIIRVQ